MEKNSVGGDALRPDAPEMVPKARRIAKEGRALFYARSIESARRRNALYRSERLDDHEDDDSDHQYRRHLIDDPPVTSRPAASVLGEKPHRIRQVAVYA